MNIARATSRLVAGAIDTATSTAGAVGGAAVGVVTGGVQGSLNGLRNGMQSGTHSTPAALVTLGAIGAAGLVDWPVLLGIGGVALLTRYLNQDSAPEIAAVRSSDAAVVQPTPITKTAPAKAAASKAAPAKKAARTTPTRSRSTAGKR